MRKILFILLFISTFTYSDVELWSSKGDESIKFYLDLEVITDNPENAIELIKEMVVFIKKTERDTKFYEYYISEDKKMISLIEHYQNAFYIQDRRNRYKLIQKDLQPPL